MITQNKVANKIANDLKNFGGYLECQTCGKRKELGSIANKLSNSWPKCCSYTMR